MTEIDTNQQPAADVLRMTVDIVSAYVRKNSLTTNDLPEVIHAVHGSLLGLRDNPIAPAEPLKPAVPPRKSVTADYIVCLEDGKKLKMLKRHLRTAYSLSPEEYRAKWGLQPDYPMVAPNYAKRRSDFAKKIGLGQKEKRGKASA